MKQIFFERINRSTAVFIMTLWSLAIFYITTLLASNLESGVIPFIGGIICLIAAIFLHHFGKKKAWLYFLGLTLNLCGSGLFAALLYIETSLEFIPVNGAAALFPAALMSFIGFILLRFLRKWRAFSIILCAIVCLGLMIWGIVLCFQSNASFFSYACFGLFIALVNIFIGLRAITSDKHPALHYISIGGFGAFSVIAAVVIIIVTDGDALDGLFDGFFEGIGEIASSIYDSKRQRRIK